MGSSFKMFEFSWQVGGKKNLKNSSSRYAYMSGANYIFTSTSERAIWLSSVRQFIASIEIMMDHICSLSSFKKSFDETQDVLCCTREWTLLSFQICSIVFLPIKELVDLNSAELWQHENVLGTESSAISTSGDRSRTWRYWNIREKWPPIKISSYKIERER